MPREHMYDEIANDLSLWLDQTANEVALAFAPGRAPFSAKITEQQKLEYYKERLFNPDGSPNQPGRQAEIERLGAEDFGRVYKAVVQAFPQLKPPSQPAIEVPQQWPGPSGPPGPLVPPMMPGPPGPPGPSMVPPGIRPMAQGGVVTEPTVALIGEAG